MDEKFHLAELLTVAEVAAALRVSKMTVYRMVHAGDLSFVQFGRSFRIPAAAVEAYMPEVTSFDPHGTVKQG